MKKIFWILFLTVFFTANNFALAYYNNISFAALPENENQSGSEQEPGPSFKNWHSMATDKNTESQYLAAKFYSDNKEPPFEVGMLVIYLPTEEIVMKSWGLQFIDENSFNTEKMRVAIKQLDNTWIIGEPGKFILIKIESKENDEPTRMGYYVETPDGLVGRIFPR